MSAWSIRRIATAIQQGAIIAYPTDTIWGFGCDPLNYLSVNRLLAIKQRPQHKGLILLANKVEQCEGFIDSSLTRAQLQLLAQKQNHPITWLIPASPDCPSWLTGDSTDIAIRISDHPFIRQLGKILHAPIVSTSANRAGQATMRSALQLHKHFHSELDFIISGYKTSKAQASEIKSLRSGKTIRAYQPT